MKQDNAKWPKKMKLGLFFLLFLNVGQILKSSIMTNSTE